MRCLALKSSIFLLFFFNISAAFSQLGTITFDLQKDKPKKFENKVLKSEKTGEKKWTLKKRITQNTVSHYNYYFNANNKLNQVIESARNANKDDYGKLLPFYGYSLNTTAAQKTELDSVIYKATAGILLHDLRSDWVDNLYLLIGKSYYFQKEFDSAGMTFQFINYNLYPRKKKGDDFAPVVGTNANAGGSSISIASNEKDRSLLNKTFVRPPSRNDALVWQIRTLIETGEYTDAAGLINTLQNDQNFPSRLKSDLEEVNAYWFFKQKMYDSAANHLEKALNAAEDKQDRSRWEYLLAQLFEINKDPESASEYYKKAMRHTTDPLLDIYANLNNAKIYKGNDIKEYNNTIDNLVRMAKRDKYESYRDIIYYSAGELALQKPDTAAAEFLFNKSISYNELNNTVYKNRAYLQLADIAFNKKDYKSASALYDSLDIKDDVLIERVKDITDRKNALAQIVQRINIIEREDSLQKIAQMSEVERESFLKDLLKRLRKGQGLKDVDYNSANPSSAFDNNQNSSIDIFGTNNTKGDWYFYNASIKAKGFSEFRSRWGNRQNVDNWRRSSSANGTFNSVATTLPVQTNNTPTGASVLSYEGLLTNVPLTPEKLNASNIALASSLFELGQLYQNNLEDYRLAAQTYETSLQRFPNILYNGELYMNLFYCYQKLGDQAKASFYKNLLATRFNNTRFAQAVINPQSLKESTKDIAATKRYENIYTLFIEGQFEKAVKDKKAADSLYGNTYWSPQLLYIESVYYVKQKQDSQAIVVLTNIINQYPTSPLKNRAETMIDVLKRRKEIEGYLTSLQVTRMKEDSVLAFNDEPVQKVVTPQPKVEQPKKVITEEKKEIVQTPVPVKPQPITNGTFSFSAEEPQNVIMILDKVDPVYISEARNAFIRYNREKFSAQAIDVVKDAIDKDRNILIFSKFADANAAITYADRLKKNAAAEVSWLPANKYSFLIISDANLQVLKANKDFAGYIKLLNSKYPGKF